MTDRLIGWLLEIDWDRDGAFSDESANFIAARGVQRVAAPESSITSPRGIVDQVNIELYNTAGRYNPLDSASPLFAAITGGGAYQAPVRLSVLIDATPTRLFTGVIANPDVAGLAATQAPSITMDCRSREHLLLQQRLSTLQSQFRTWRDEGRDEGRLIVDLLTAAGLTDGVDFVGPDSPASTINPGLFILPWAWLDEESVLEEIWLIAAACGGRFLCGRDGVMRYYSIQDVAADTPTPVALTPANYTAAAAYYDDRELYDSVTVEFAARMVGAYGALWTPDETITVPPGGGQTAVSARLNQPLYTAPTIAYRALTAGAHDITADVILSTTAYAQRVELLFTNNHASKLALLRNLAVEGYPVLGDRGEEVTLESSQAFWATRNGRNRSVRGNPYVQTIGQARMLAEFLRDRHETPRLFYRIRAASDPAIAPGAYVEIDDPDLTPDGARLAIATTTNWTLNQAGFAQDIEAVDAAGLLPYWQTDPSYFIIGTNTLGAASPDPGRIYY